MISLATVCQWIHGSCMATPLCRCKATRDSSFRIYFVNRRCSRRSYPPPISFLACILTWVDISWDIGSSFKKRSYAYWPWLWGKISRCLYYPHELRLKIMLHLLDHMHMWQPSCTWCCGGLLKEGTSHFMLHHQRSHSEDEKRQFSTSAKL